MTDFSDRPLPLQIVDLGVMIERRWAEILSPHNISPAEYRLLAVLSEIGPTTAVEIGPLITLEQSLISRTVQRLFEKELLVRQRSQKDRRRVTLRATPAGVTLVRQLLGPLNQLANTLTAIMTDQQRGQIEATIAVMAGSMGILTQPR